MSEPDFDAMTPAEFQAYPDSPEKKDYIVSIYRAENERIAALIAARREQA